VASLQAADASTLTKAVWDMLEDWDNQITDKKSNKTLMANKQFSKYLQQFSPHSPSGPQLSNTIIRIIRSPVYK
jgi:hypothetical protein